MLNKSTLESFAAPCPKQGKLELVHYTSRAYALEAIFGESPITMEKSMWVYTPYGYDPSKKYNVLFLMHGGTDNEGYWFGQGRYRGDDVQKYTDYGNITASMIDHLIYKKQIDPLIVVTPSFEEEVEPYTKLGNRKSTTAPTRKATTRKAIGTQESISPMRERPRAPSPAFTPLCAIVMIALPLLGASQPARYGVLSTERSCPLRWMRKSWQSSAPPSSRNLRFSGTTGAGMTIRCIPAIRKPMTVC